MGFALLLAASIDGTEAEANTRMRTKGHEELRDEYALSP
jgi:hypothetical protein